MTKKIVPQQYAGVRPPKGWVPPLDAVLTLLGVYDNVSGFWVGLPLQALTEALLVAEALHTEDRIDERNKIEITVPNGTAKDTVKTQEYEIPSGEVWYFNRLNLVTEAEISGNIRISKFPSLIPWIKHTWGLTWQPARTSTTTWLLPGSSGPT